MPPFNENKSNGPVVILLITGRVTGPSIKLAAAAALPVSLPLPFNAAAHSASCTAWSRPCLVGSTVSFWEETPGWFHSSPPHQAEPLQVFQLSSPSSLGTVSPNWVIESEGFLMPEPERLRASLRCPSSLEQAQCSPVLSAAGIFSRRFCWNRVDLLCVCHVTIVAGFVFCVSVSRGEWSEASTHRRAPTGPQHAAPRSGPWLRPLCSILCGHALFTLMYASTWSSVSSLMKFLF